MFCFRFRHAGTTAAEQKLWYINIKLYLVMLHHFVIIFILALALMLGRHGGATATMPESSGQPTRCARTQCDAMSTPLTVVVVVVAVIVSAIICSSANRCLSQCLRKCHCVAVKFIYCLPNYMRRTVRHDEYPRALMPVALLLLSANKQNKDELYRVNRNKIDTQSSLSYWNYQ